MSLERDLQVESFGDLIVRHNRCTLTAQIVHILHVECALIFIKLGEEALINAGEKK